MKKETKMECLEFKRLALSEPNSTQHRFVEHSKECPDCLKYVTSIRQMDADLSQSLSVSVPQDLMAKIQLNQELAEVKEAYWTFPKAIAAGLAGVFALGILLSNVQLFAPAGIQQDYEQLLSAVVEHVNHHPVTPVYASEQANRSVQAVLASYDSNVKLKYMENLQFGKICPMGKYHGLHATLDTPDGQVMFAYLKGDAESELRDLSMDGYVSRVKPVKGGNLVIISRNARSLQTADEQLTESMYWDI
ncbi:MAG: DUF3379 family protein [Pseudomonadota bacterium]